MHIPSEHNQITIEHINESHNKKATVLRNVCIYRIHLNTRSMFVQH